MSTQLNCNSDQPKNVPPEKIVTMQQYFWGEVIKEVRPSSGMFTFAGLQVALLEGKRVQYPTSASQLDTCVNAKSPSKGLVVRC